MTQESGFHWSKKTEEAAVLVADDDLTDEQIASSLSISRATLTRWKARPEFRARVQSHIDRLAHELSRYAIARKDKRVAAYQDRWERMKSLVEAREQSLRGEAHGGETGLLYEDVVAGSDGATVTKYPTDTGLLSAMLNLEKQAAQEAGQWTEKSETKHAGEILVRRYIGVDLEQI